MFVVCAVNLDVAFLLPKLNIAYAFCVQPATYDG